MLILQQLPKLLQASIHLPALLIVAVALTLIPPASVTGEPRSGESGSALRVYYVDGRPCVLTDEEAEAVRANGSDVHVQSANEEKGVFDKILSPGFMRILKYAGIVICLPFFLLRLLNSRDATD